MGAAGHPLLCLRLILLHRFVKGQRKTQLLVKRSDPTSPGVGGGSLRRGLLRRPSLG